MLSSIDLGTNTCLLLIADSGRIVHDESTVVRLGQGVDKTRSLNPDAIERTLQCLKRYSATVKEHGLDPAKTVAVATSQARDAENFSKFESRVKAETGFRLRVLSGDEEARASFQGGLLPGMDPKGCAVIDIGGGSTEFMSSQGGESLDIGAVRFTERFFKTDPVSDPEFWACQAAVDAEIEKMLLWKNSLAADTKLVAVAGTATSLAQWHLGLSKFDVAQIDGLLLTRGDLHRLTEELKWRTVNERAQIPGLDTGRADVILAGALILYRAHEVLGFRECTISTRGLRFGVLTMG